MHAIEKFQKHNNSPWFKKFKSNTQYKSFFDKNKYFFNEMYKIKAIPTEDLVFVITRILKHKIEEPTKIDLQIKKIARGFVEDHHELFPENIEDNTEDLEHAYEGDTPKYIINSNNKNMSENVKNRVENDDKNYDENRVENDDKNINTTETIEKIEEIKQDVEKIEEIQKEHPNFKHIEEFHNKIEELKEDIHKKFNDMIDAHMDLKKSIEEKRNISNHDAKSRIENMEGKIEMLYGKQMEESTKQKKQHYVTKPKTKEDMLQHYINKKLNK